MQEKPLKTAFMAGSGVFLQNIIRLSASRWVGVVNSSAFTALELLHTRLKLSSDAFSAADYLGVTTLR
ncbi:hypothetical protein [Paenibacillus albidus]|uniref:hypothetical protein n=1 Tax=Paenibacillus albidus TaxID=2041023 RepID=UPI00166DE4E5|nr:hypothetical protein [Paenibacillus albidus]